MICINALVATPAQAPVATANVHAQVERQSVHSLYALFLFVKCELFSIYFVQWKCLLATCTKNKTCYVTPLLLNQLCKLVGECCNMWKIWSRTGPIRCELSNRPEKINCFCSTHDSKNESVAYVICLVIILHRMRFCSNRVQCHQKLHTVSNSERFFIFRNWFVIALSCA